LRAATNDDKQLEYKVEPGVFKRLCDDARTQGAQIGAGIRTNPRIWKISINGTGPSPTLTYCLEHGEARIGWGKTGDLLKPLEANSYYDSLGSGDRGTLRYFAEEIVPGDILLCIHSSETISAVGVVTSEYRFEETVPSGVVANYNHVRSVNWLYHDLKLSIFPLNDDKQFVAKTVYQMDRFTWGDLLTYLEQSGVKPTKTNVGTGERKPHVLIIDEINRGNISRIFGELITLIEPSKRAGADEALELTLPYSKRPFSVPSNVYLIGTMNTADRSLTGLDIALRRRFIFKEMAPNPELLDEINIDDVNIGAILRKMNERIEVLLDRDHSLGHAYFIPLKKNNNISELQFIFRQQILPLLQEYFFEDWERIAWVLNSQNKLGVDAFIQKASTDLASLFGSEIANNLQNSDRRWRINEEAFGNIECYRNILGASQ
jgi:5-methylcytosine-specific restriction protein B